MPTTPQDSPSSLGTGVNSGAEDSKHPTTITGWLASKAGMWRVAVWKMRRCWQYMGTAPYVVTKPLILQSLIFPPCGTVPPLLSCARTHHETRDQVIAKSSSPWVLYLSIAVTGNSDGSFSKAPRSSHFSPHTHPSPSQLLLGSDGFRRGDTVLVSSRSSRSKINGGRLGDSGDNEDHNRRQIVSEEPHRCCACMKSSRALVRHVLYSICVCLSHFDDLFRLSIFVPCLMECHNCTRVQ